MNTTTNQLIPVFAGEISGISIQLVDARLLHQALEVARDFTTWIKKRLTDGGFFQDQDYLLTKTGEQLPSGTKYRSDYHLTIETAKHIGMMERNEKGRQIRDYFIAMEKTALQQQPLETFEQFPEPKTKKALPGCLNLEQQDCIKALVKERVEILPKNKQAKAAISCWSAIKSKFELGKEETYKNVPAEQFTSVVSLISRLPLEGELLPNPEAKPAVYLYYYAANITIDRQDITQYGVYRSPTLITCYSDLTAVMQEAARQAATDIDPISGSYGLEEIKLIKAGHYRCCTIRYLSKIN
jgi:phage anti-repressor protein